MKFFPVLFCILLPFKGEVFASSPQFLIHILDYLAQDYGGAVSEGKVLSPFEYEEQVEFSRTALRAYEQLPETQKTDDLHKDFLRLKELIHLKAPPPEVENLARRLQAQIIRISGMEMAPQRWPNRKTGEALFVKNCISCHGVMGRGDGPLAKGLEPPPSNFHNETRMVGISPFQAYNTIRFGIPNTAMVSFANLSDPEVWDLAFYVVSLRYEGIALDSKTDPQNNDALFQRFPLKTLSTSSDERLKEQLNGSPDKIRKMLASLRLETPQISDGALNIARRYLKESLADYEKGDKAAAREKALLAYLEGVEPIELRLRALDSSLTLELESRMASVRSLIEKESPVESLRGASEELGPLFDRAASLLHQSTPTMAFVFFMAASIILREGFEAVLIIVSILGVLRVIGERKASRWVHGGWAVALLLGVILWIFSGWLMGISGAGREMMEGITSLTAVAVLLYVGFWLHSKTEIRRWTKFIDGRTRKALAGGSFLGLATISFMAVFREAFETVLFLRALWLEGGASAKTAMSFGIFTAFILIFLLAYALLKFSVRLPIQKLFNFSALLMSVLAVILTGKGLRSLQETGLISMTASPLKLNFDLLGFYPTWETILTQMGVVILIVALWIYGKKTSGLKTT